MQPAPRFTSLEAFRGLAAIVIVLYHSRFFSENSASSILYNGAFILMDFFFIMSGFVMAYGYAHKIGGDMTFKKFLTLRFARLYPLHLFTLLLWVPYILIKVLFYRNGIGDTDPTEANNVFTLASNMFLVHGLDGDPALSWNYPAWSISVEFYTYMVFFLVIWVLPRPSSWKMVVWAALATSIISYLLLFFFFKHYEIFFLECIGGFFLGVCMYLLYRKLTVPHVNPWAATVFEVASLGAVFYGMSKLQKQDFGDPFYYLMLLGISLLIFTYTLQSNGHVSRLLKSSFLQHLGRISYSMYMLHAIILAATENWLVYVLKYNKTSFGQFRDVLVFDAATYLNLALLVIVILLASLSYKYIEMPFRMRLTRLGTKPEKVNDTSDQHMG